GPREPNYPMASRGTSSHGPADFRIRARRELRPPEEKAEGGRASAQAQLSQGEHRHLDRRGRQSFWIWARREPHPPEEKRLREGERPREPNCQDALPVFR